MPDKPKRLYWDSCVLLSYINGDDDRIEVLDQLLDDAEAGGVEIVTSTLSIVEVAFGKAEQDSGDPDPAVLDAIQALWIPPSPVMLVEFHRRIADRAREFVRAIRLEEGQRLSPPDAIHLATAQHMSAVELQTYDGKLTRLPITLPFHVVEPWTDSPRISGWSDATGETDSDGG